MKRSFRIAWLPVFLVPLLLLAGSAHGQAGSASLLTLPDGLQTAAGRYAAALKPITDQRDQRVAAAGAVYSAALQNIQKGATARGDLDLALAAKGERDWLAADAATDTTKSLPKAILPYRQRFDQAKARAIAQATREETAVTRSYIGMLADLQTRITKRGDLDAAAEVKEARLAAIAKVTALESGKAAAPNPAAEVAIAPNRQAPRLGSGDALQEPDPIGRWAWSSARVITINPDGTFVVDKGGGGKWRWTRRSKDEFTMIWDSGGYRDSLALSSDGRRITGSNNKGDKVNVTRIE